MRDLSVSIAKGIAIILMVMGHAGCPDTMNRCLGMMHMPLFFFKMNEYKEIIDILKKRK